MFQFARVFVINVQFLGLTCFHIHFLQVKFSYTSLMLMSTPDISPGPHVHDRHTMCRWHASYLMLTRCDNWYMGDRAQISGGHVPSTDITQHGHNIANILFILRGFRSDPAWSQYYQQNLRYSNRNWRSLHCISPKIFGWL